MRIAIVGEAWGKTEAQFNHRFVGSSGIELGRMLNQAGITTKSPYDYQVVNSRGVRLSLTVENVVQFWKDTGFLVTNVVNAQPPGNDFSLFCAKKGEMPEGYALPPISQGKYLKPEHLHHITRLVQEITDYNPDLIITLGNIPMWALTSQTGISKLRGTVTLSTTGHKLLPTYHPAYVLRNWAVRPITIADLIKAKREAGFREIVRPHRELWIEPSLADLDEFYHKHILTAKLIAPDIETAHHHGIITCVGFAVRPNLGICIPLVDRRNTDYHYWPTKEEEIEAIRWIRRYLHAPAPKVAQNGSYDFQWLWEILKVRPVNWLHDTMLLHHALQPEMEKSLGFMASVYTNEVAWKVLRPRQKDLTEKRDD